MELAYPLNSTNLVLKVYHLKADRVRAVFVLKRFGIYHVDDRLDYRMRGVLQALQ